MFCAPRSCNHVLPTMTGVPLCIGSLLQELLDKQSQSYAGSATCSLLVSVRGLFQLCCANIPKGKKHKPCVPCRCKDDHAHLDMSRTFLDSHGAGDTWNGREVTWSFLDGAPEGCATTHYVLGHGRRALFSCDVPFWLDVIVAHRVKCLSVLRLRILRTCPARKPVVATRPQRAVHSDAGVAAAAALLFR